MMTIKQIEVTVGDIARGYINNEEQEYVVMVDNWTFAHLINVSLYIMRTNNKL